MGLVLPFLFFLLKGNGKQAFSTLCAKGFLFHSNLQLKTTKSYPGNNYFG